MPRPLTNERNRIRAVVVDFGRRVRALRLGANMSQPELARRARCGGKFIGQIERGETNPSLESMVLVADALGCDITDLLQGAREKTPSPYVALNADDTRRVQDAVAVLNSVLTPRKNVRRRV